MVRMLFQVLFSIFIDLSLIGLAVSLILREERSFSKTMKRLGFRKIGFKGLLEKTGKILLLLVFAAIWLQLVIRFLGLDDLELVSQAVEESFALLPMFFWLVMLRAVSEEVFFRGLLVDKIGVFGSSLVFGILHIGYGSIAEVVGAFVLGLILAKAYQLNKNLYPNILGHALYNAMAMFAVFF